MQVTEVLFKFLLTFFKIKRSYFITMDINI